MCLLEQGSGRLESAFHSGRHRLVERQLTLVVNSKDILERSDFCQKSAHALPVGLCHRNLELAHDHKGFPEAVRLAPCGRLRLHQNLDSGLKLTALGMEAGVEQELQRGQRCAPNQPSQALQLGFGCRRVSELLKRTCEIQPSVPLRLGC